MTIFIRKDICKLGNRYQQQLTYLKEPKCSILFNLFSLGATHPFVASYINKGWFFSSIKHKWENKFKKTIKVIGDDRLHLLQYSIVKKQLFFSRV